MLGLQTLSLSVLGLQTFSMSILGLQTLSLSTLGLLVLHPSLQTLLAAPLLRELAAYLVSGRPSAAASGVIQLLTILYGVGNASFCL